MSLGLCTFRILPFLAVLVLAGGCSKELTPVERWLIKGDRLYRKGDLEGASECYKEATALEQNNPRTLARVGRVAFDQGRTLSAYFLLKGTVSKISEETEFQLVYGLACHAVGRTAEARAIAKKAIESDPTNETALILLIETGIGSRDAHEARRIIEQAEAKAGKPMAIFHVARGILDLSRRDNEAAEKEIRQALELDPKSAAAHSQLATILLARKDVAGAEVELKTAADLSPIRSPRRIRYINLLVDLGRTAEAQKELDRLATEAPDYVPAWSVAMKLAFLLGKPDEALNYGNKVLDVDQTNYDAWMVRVAIKLQKNQIEDVIADLKRAEGYYNRSAEVKYKLALAYMEKDDLPSAESSLYQALRLSPTNEDALLLQADIDLRQGEYKAALTSMTQLVQREPRSSRARLTLAEAQRAAGEIEASIATYGVLAETFPSVPDSHHYIGLMQMERGNRAEAREAFERALSISDKYWPAVEMLTELDLVEGRDALGRIEAAVTKYPDAVPPLLLRAKVRLLLGDVTGAESDLHRGLVLAPNEPYSYLVLARIYDSSGRVREGREKLAALAERNPTPAALTQLGMLQAAEGTMEKAKASYEQALALDPKFVPALNNLAMLLAEQGGDIDRATDLARQARKVAPDDPYVADTNAWILAKGGQYHAALRVLQPIVERLPGDPEIQYHLGMIYYYLGYEEQARTTLGTALATSSSSAVKRSAEARLTILKIDQAQPPAAARPAIEEAVRIDPNDLPALMRLGALELAAGRHSESAKYYETALNLNPKMLPTLKALIDLYTGPIPSQERARELARLARDSSPNDPQLAWKLGRLLYEAGDYMAANGMLLEAAQRFPDERGLQFDLALSHYAIGRVAEAEQTLARGIGNPDDPAANPAAVTMARLIAAVRTMNPNASEIATADRVLRDTPNDIPALMVKAAAAERRNAHTAAREIYDQVMALNSQFVPAMRQLASLYGDQFGDDDKCEEWARKVLKVLPDDPEASYQLGVVLFRRGEHEAAVRSLVLSMRRRPNHAMTHFFLGMAHAQLKNGAEARTALETALRLRLPSQEAAQALRTLEELGFRVSS
jgi:tetratricopeptide (TPR) repeat protein